MINSFLAKKLYILASKARGENIDSHLEVLKKSQWFSPERLRKVQWQKLIKLINHAYRKSPYYKKRFDAYGLLPGDIKVPEDMLKVPILTKKDLREHFNELKVASGAYRYSLAKTSGSTGTALKFYKDRNSSGNGRAAMYRGHSWYDIHIGDREAKLWGVPLGTKEKLIARAGDYFLNRFREKDFQLTEPILSGFLSNIKRYKPKYLMGYSSLAYQFAQYFEANGIDASAFELKMVKVTAETLFDYQRDLIARVFNCPVAVEYGATEVGIISFECPNNGHHIASENIFIESIDVHGDARKEFIITDLNNYYSPVIRYQIGDYGLLSEDSCRCGRGLPLLKEIIGRVSDVVYKADNTPVHSAIFSYILKDITGSNGGINQYKIYQEAKGALRIELVKNNNFSDATLTMLKKNIYKHLGADMKISVQYVANIKREASGKLRYFVSSVQ